MIRAILISSLLFLVACSAYKTLPPENKELVKANSHWKIVSNKESGNVLRQAVTCPSYLQSGIVVSKYVQRKGSIKIKGVIGYHHITYDSLLNPIEHLNHHNSQYIIYSCNIENDSITNLKELIRDKKHFKLLLHNDSSKYLILYNYNDSIGIVHNEKHAIEGMFYDSSIK